MEILAEVAMAKMVLVAEVLIQQFHWKEMVVKMDLAMQRLLEIPEETLVIIKDFALVTNLN